MRKPSLLAVALRYVVLVAMALVIIVPLATTVMNGFKSNAEVIADPVALPSVLLWANYGDILAGSAFWRQMLNSTIVMAATTLGTVALAAMAAFVFARIQFRGREYIYNFILIGLLFPTTVAILPLYITLRQAGLLNSLMGVILPQIAFGLPTSILILRGFFAAVPLELEQAATIDGCSRFRFFFSILLPLASSSSSSALGLRQVHAAPPRRRARGHHLGHISIDNQVVNDAAAGRPRHRHGLSVLCALPAHDGLREHGLRPEAGEGRRPGGSIERGQGRGPHPAARPPARPAAVSSRAASASASRSAGRSSGSPRSSCSTSPCPTSMPPCACRCGSRSPSCTTRSTRR
jgi:ABC-type glycerol-3-phosphate transport system permease component